MKIMNCAVTFKAVKTYLVYEAQEENPPKKILSNSLPSLFYCIPKNVS